MSHADIYPGGARLGTEEAVARLGSERKGRLFAVFIQTPLDYIYPGGIWEVAL